MTVSDSPFFVTPSAPLPSLRSPFAVLLDATDAEWADDALLRSTGRALLDGGCLYFVCFGHEAERIHDVLDDVIVDGGYAGVTTTFHDSEGAEDVADFFKTIATAGMKGALVVVRDTRGWVSRLTPWA